MPKCVMAVANKTTLPFGSVQNYCRFGDRKLIRNVRTYVPLCTALLLGICRYNDQSLGCRIRSSNPGWNKIFFPCRIYQNHLWGPHNIQFNGWHVAFFGAKRSGHEAHQSPLPNVDITNDWSYISTPTIGIQGLKRENFTFLTFSLCVILRLCSKSAIN